MGNKDKLTEIQILRAFAFIFVILQHSLGSTALEPIDTNIGIYLEGVLFTFAESAVPIFLFISGLTLTYAYKDKLDLKKYYKNRFLYLIFPYFIWSFINMIVYNPEKISNFIIETIAGNGNFHLWYMGMIIRMVLIFPVIIYIARFINRRNKVIKIITFIVVCIGSYEITSKQWLIEDYIGKVLFGVPTPLQERIISLSILFWIYFLLLGVFVGFNYSNFREKTIKYRYVIYGILILTFMYKFQFKYDATNYNRIYCMLYRTVNILFFYLLSFKIKEELQLGRILSFIGKYSYVGYMMHTMVLYSIMAIIKFIGITNGVLNGVMSCAATAIIAPFLIYKLTGVKNSKYITGIKN